ncbi:acyl-CoA synthetase [Halieaceae bacterium IMCC14734]|uniref:Acyl-CoA synthetase n=1 Tax=Candidatus Litorirhabdus singularis TaxID=2518993 RepID=A0ABT3TEG6_9GAMM|nr:acyl-CoA synthetase [Candidatus Litorirhabdus singularis]MCX2980711.1 acyl-CoA synthetase [Candidatus Litorirhabdus singularis]
MAHSLGDVFDGIARVVDPNSPALVHGDRVINWQAFDQRTNNLARSMLERGIASNDKVAVFSRNCAEYSEAIVAAFKSRTVHLNVNYRYTPEELFYIFDNSDAAVVFFSSEFAPQMEALRQQLDKVRLFIEICPLGQEPLYEGALAHEQLALAGSGAPLDIERSGDELFFLYTGGTTGMPKGVMWSHEAFRQIGAGRAALAGRDYSDLTSTLASIQANQSQARMLPACPLMHGTGLVSALLTLLDGGAVVTMDSATGFDPHEMWRTVAGKGVTAMAIVGDAFARPLLKALREQPGRYDLDHVNSITSSGVMWSREVKLGLLEHMPNVLLVDSFGASEAIGFGSSTMANGRETTTARFEIGEHCKVFNEQDREVLAGSGEPGYIARGGSIPLGYYKDPEKTAQTFRIIDGVRYSIPGDWCTVDEDGAITLLGRGSVCINSGGEKIYPEEVEETIKSLEGINDVLVVGVPDERWGAAVVAVLEGSQLPEDQIKAHIKDHLAGYKVPRHFLYKEDLGRAPNGKADYKAIRNFALKSLDLT